MIGLFRCNSEFCKYFYYCSAVSPNQFFSKNIACTYFTFMYSLSQSSIHHPHRLCASKNTLGGKTQCQENTTWQRIRAQGT